MSEIRKRVDEKPIWLIEQKAWTLPVGWKHPSCPGCSHVFWAMRPKKSVGGASVPGPFCRACEREQQATSI